MKNPIPLSVEILVAARTDPPSVERLVPELAACNPTAISGDAARIAFWVNLYNALVRTAVRAEGLRGDLRTHRRFFHRAAWKIGDETCSLHVIEHGILRNNRPAPWTFWRPLSKTDPRLSFAPSQLDPRVHFALNCGAVSCPPIRAYDPTALDHQLDLATRSYLSGEVSLHGRTLQLPYLCHLYARDFGDRAALLAFIARHTDIRISHPNPRVTWGPYRWEIVTE